MRQDMVDSLKSFIRSNTVSGIENNGSRLWYYTVDINNVVKPIINVVFSRYQGYTTTQTTLSSAGFVLAIPSYWIDIDPNLTVAYVASFVDKYLVEQFPEVFGSSAVDASDCILSNFCPHPTTPCAQSGSVLSEADMFSSVPTPPPETM